METSPSPDETSFLYYAEISSKNGGQSRQKWNHLNFENRLGLRFSSVLSLLDIYQILHILQNKINMGEKKDIKNMKLK